MSLALPTAADSKPVRAAKGLYYGWTILLMASIAMTATLPGRTHGLGLITKPLTDDLALGVNEAAFSHLNFWAVLIGSAICIPTGRAIDRFGTRLVLTIVAVVLGMSVGAMTVASNWIWMLIALTFVRGFGQGALSVVSMAMVGKWFTNRLAIAMGLFSVLLAIGFIIATVGTSEAVQAFGWREAWLGIAAFLLFGLAPASWLFVRNTPESIGRFVDASTDADQPIHSVLQDLPVRQALCSSAFWIVTIATAVFQLTWSAVTLFQESLLVDRGFDHNSFTLVMGLLVFAGLPANLLTGWLAKPHRIGGLLAIGMLLLAGSLAAFPSVQTTTHLVWYGLSLGFSGGVITVIFFSAYGQAFGRTHLGVIQSVVQVIMTLASAAGPILMTTFKSNGLTALFFYLSAAFAMLLAGFATARSRRPSPLKSPAVT